MNQLHWFQKFWFLPHYCVTTRSQSFCEIHWSSSPSSSPWLKYRSTTRTFTVYSTYSQHNSISGDWQKDLTSVFLPNVATVDCGVLTSSPVTQIIRLQLSVTVLRNSDQSMWNLSLVNAHTQTSHSQCWACRGTMSQTSSVTSKCSTSQINKANGAVVVVHAQG